MNRSPSTGLVTGLETTVTGPDYRSAPRSLRTWDITRLKVNVVFRLPDCLSPWSRPEQTVDELLGVERGQVVGTLAQTDELDGYAELALDGDDDAPLGRPVELREH